MKLLTGSRFTHRFRRAASLCLLMLVVVDVGFTGVCDRHSLTHSDHHETVVAYSVSLAQVASTDSACCHECFCCSNYTMASLPVPQYGPQITIIDVLQPLFSTAFDGPAVYHPPRDTAALLS